MKKKPKKPKPVKAWGFVSKKGKLWNEAFRVRWQAAEAMGDGDRIVRVEIRET